MAQLNLLLDIGQERERGREIAWSSFFWRATE